MLKGVNKLIIEVSNPQSEFFERAIFFVKPERSNIVTREIDQNVQDIMGKAGKIKPGLQKPGKLNTILKLVGAASIGAAIGGLIMKFLV